MTSLSGAKENGNNMQQFSTTATAVNNTSSSNLSGQSNVSGQRSILIPIWVGEITMSSLSLKASQAHLMMIMRTI